MIMMMNVLRVFSVNRSGFVLLLLLSTFLGKITSEPIDPDFKEPISNVTASVGREATLSCTVQDLGSYKVAWLRVDTQTILTIAKQVITKNYRIGVTHTDHRIWILHIREVRETDRGWYMCQINTDPMKSQVGYLDVTVPPDIVDFQTSTDMVVREGSNVTLKCAATGSPTPNITWRREDGQTILLGNGRKAQYVEGPLFEITKVNRLHMGSYLCIASNGVPPSVSKRITLIVHFPPMIWIQNQLVGAREGQQITLECHSEAYPKSINYWTMEKDEIVPQSGKYELSLEESEYKVQMKLTIRTITASDYGTYKCISRNSLGDTDGSIKLYRKSRKNSGNEILEGNQDMLKERDPDYDSSESSSTKCNFALITPVLLMVVYSHHHPQLQALHPA
ncbi:limbic system-associated membrane protein-like isoform X2 [Leptopilina boulardi]|uniref:limbic system-associated membrane protein-like isoform X2 n=1 Tax=Leptopilina boulardi TaxID=63433 RepID=UPI0021F59E19|nr:limbic system-associated membrane protein-like isoform X2 [Leptopilina boulardi]